MLEAKEPVLQEDETNSCEDDVEVEYLLVAPDGGWGWVIVAAAFFCNCVVDGITFTFGVYLPEIVKTYNTSEAFVALIGSCMFGLHLAAGPLCAALTKSFGFRPVVVFGSIFTAASLACAAFTPPLWLLTITHGILTGSGLCLVYMNCLTIVSTYFCKYRLAAIGVVVSGTGCGTAVFALAGHYMLERMTWQQAQLVLALCALLMAVAGLAFRPLQPVPVHSSPTDDHPLLPMGRTLHDDDDENDDRDGSSRTVLLRRVSNTSANSLLSAVEALSNEIYCTQAFQNDCWQHSTCFSCVRPSDRYIQDCINEVEEERVATNEEATSGTSVRKWSKTAVPGERRSVRDIMTETMTLDWSLLKDLHFSLFCISGGFCCTAVVLIFAFEKVKILEAGLSKETATYFLATLGLANMAWRLTMGVVTNNLNVDYHGMNVASHFIGGLCVILSVFSKDIVSYYVLCIIFGSAVAAFAVFRPVILVDLVGIEKVSDGAGISLMITGAFSIAGAPLGGYLCDMYGSYDYVYYLAGTLLILTGTMLWFTASELKRRQLVIQ